MKRLLILTLFFCSTLTLLSQSFVSDNRNSIKVSYGQFLPLNSQFRNPFKTGFNGSVAEPIPFISSTREHPRGYGKRNDFGEGGFTYFFNQSKIYPDSSKTNWSAFNLFGVLKHDFLPQNKYIDICVGIGPLFGTQVVKATKTVSKTYLNINASIIPYFDLRFQPSKFLSLGLNASFLYDLTRSKWLSVNNNKDFVIDYNKFSGTTVSFFIAYCYGQ